MRRTFFILLIVCLFGGMISGSFYAITRDLPEIRALEHFQPAAETTIYSREGAILATLSAERRQPVTFDQIPPRLIAAFLNTEDRQFYTHPGISFKSILRAIITDLRAGAFVQGASTITQQLSKVLFLSPQKTITRKLKEAILAIQIERHYTKNEILTLYLNQIYLGHGVYGVSAAARDFFGKSLSELTLAEMALLAGLPRAPSYYAPRTHPDRAKKRRNIVLSSMRAEGLISPETCQNAQNEPLALSPASPENNLAPQFADRVVERLAPEIGENRLYRGGLSIHTGLSARAQHMAQQAIDRTLKKHDDFKAESAIVSLAVETGSIFAMYAAPAEGALWEQPLFQPNTVFLPFIFAFGWQQGYLPDGPPDGSVRQALINQDARLPPALSNPLNVAPLTSFFNDLGFSPSGSSTATGAFGRHSARLIETVAAYSIFARQGIRISPYGAIQVHDAARRPLWQTHAEKKILLSQTVAASMTDILQATAAEHMAVQKGKLAGVLSLSTDRQQALIIGYTSQTVTGLWLRVADGASPQTNFLAKNMALEIWSAYLRK